MDYVNLSSFILFLVGRLWIGNSTFGICLLNGRSRAGVFFLLSWLVLLLNALLQLRSFKGRFAEKA